MNNSHRSSENAAAVPRRIEGQAKVTGAARYTGDYGSMQIGQDLLHAFIVPARAAAGRIREIDTAAAQEASGVRAVITHQNAPRLKPVKTLTGSEIDLYLPLQDDKLRYNRQPIALVVAATLEQARYAASLVTADYEASPGALSFQDELPNVEPVKKIAAGDKGTVVRGRPESAFASAPIQFDETYETEPAHHNPIEPGATIAEWGEKGRLTVWNATQFVYGDATSLGQAFGFGPLEQKLRIIPQVAAGIELGGKIRVLGSLVGGAFGSKAGNANLLLAAMAAKVAGAPVKLVMSREQMFSAMPFRSGVRQRIRIGADAAGNFEALLHDAFIQNSTVGPFIEPVGEMTPHLYACDHLKTTHSIVRLNVNAPGWMRAPGVAPGLFGLESAVDELAHRLGIDPVELRLRNYADVDPETGHEWSSKSLRECYRLAAERIGWHTRNPQCQSMREGNLLIGFGMATAAYRTNQFPSTAKIFFTLDGTAVVESAAHEIGQGLVTSLTQIAAESLGHSFDRVRFEFADSNLPFAFITAGSATTLSLGSAIKVAAEKLKRNMILRAITDKASPLYRLHSHEVTAREGRLSSTHDPLRFDTYSALVGRHARRTFAARAIAGRTFGKSRYGRAAFGAQFAQVAVDAATGQVHVRRLVGAFAGGRVINPVLAQSQLRGGMIWGLGQALLEETFLDKRNGRWVNSNLAEALVPTNLDVPQIEALLVEEDDRRGSPLGTKGLGEIGITGMAAAIANAIYHATGKRIRELPIKLDKLMMPDDQLLDEPAGSAHQSAEEMIHT